jgi:hypothetical protein
VLEGIDNAMEPVLGTDERDPRTDPISADELRHAIATAYAAGPIAVVFVHADLRVSGDHNVGPRELGIFSFHVAHPIRGGEATVKEFSVENEWSGQASQMPRTQRV